MSCEKVSKSVKFQIRGESSDRSSEGSEVEVLRGENGCRIRLQEKANGDIVVHKSTSSMSDNSLLKENSPYEKEEGK